MKIIRYQDSAGRIAHASLQADDSALEITGGGGTSIVNCVVEYNPSLPVTATVNPKLPVVAGVPLSRPTLLKLRPAGKLPDTIDHVYGVAPPLAVNVWL